MADLDKNFDFRVCLFQISNELKDKDLQGMKFLLKGYVPGAQCEEMNALQYFEELQKLLLLTPANFRIIKKALNEVGRNDLVEKIEEKEEVFASLSSENLEKKDFDAVCDGIDKAAENFKSRPRADLSTSKFHSNNMNPAMSQSFSEGSSLQKGSQVKPPTYDLEDNKPSWLKSGETGDIDMTGVEPGDVLSPSSELDSFEDLTVAKDVCDKPCESTVINGTSSEKVPVKPNLSASDLNPGSDDEVTDGNPSEKGGSKEATASHTELPTNSAGGDGTSSSVATSAKEAAEDVCTSSSSPKGTIVQDDEYLAGDFMKGPKESETATMSMQNKPGFGPHGGARPKQTKISLGVSPGKKNAKEQFDQVTSTLSHGTLIPGKMPTEDECASPTAPYPSGSINDTEGTEPSQKKAKSAVYKEHSKQGASSHDPSPPFGVDAPSYQGLPLGSPFSSGATMAPGPPPMSSSNVGSTLGSPMSSSSVGSTLGSPMQFRSYDKGGYSVVISGGILCNWGDDKGVFMMKSGAQFVIVIANNNNHAAEVDITFGGIFLGVWLVEANRPLSNPLIIEGSSWAPGRLKYFSVSDANKPKPSELFGQYPQLNGQIILEFKPEVLMLKLAVKHVWKDGSTTKEIRMPDFKTATIGQLKEKIKKEYNANVSCLILGGKVLPEDKSMSSHALENTNEVIEVLYTEEELEIQYSGICHTIALDPFNFSVDDVKNAVEQKFRIPVSEQCLRYKGENVEELTEPLYNIFVKAKAKPVISAYADREISVKVCLSGVESSKEVTINWFATVSDLKEKIIQQQICETVDTLKFDDVDISREGRRKLFDLSFKRTNTVYLQTGSRSTHRGFFSSDFGSRTRGFSSGRTRGFGDEPSFIGVKPKYRGIDYASGISTLRSGPDDMEHDSAEAFGREGVALLCGDEENVYRKFQEDKEEWKFSKERAVTLTVQLIDQSPPGATGSSASFGYMPTGSHYPENSMSTPYPHPVPE